MPKHRTNKLVTALGKGLSVFTPSDENATTILSWLVPRIKAEDLRKALYYYSKWQLSRTPQEAEQWQILCDPVPGLFSHFSTLNKHEVTVRRFGRRWWPYIERYLANPEWIIKDISAQNKDINQMLATSLGKSYMSYYSQKLHAFFKMWLLMFPRYHNDCGGVMLYGLINRHLNLWGFYCRKCHMKYAVDSVEANSYQGRKYRLNDAKQENAQPDSPATNQILLPDDR